MKRKMNFVLAFLIGFFVVMPNVNAKTTVNEQEYDNLEDAIKAVGSAEATFKLTSDEIGSPKTINIPAGASYTIDGGNFTVNYSFNLDATASENSSLKVTNLIMDGDNSLGMAINSQNQSTKPNELTLSVTNSTIRNYKSKGLYLTNIKNLLIDNVKFNDLATTTQTWCTGDYALDVNLIGVQNAEITIKNSTFAGHSGGNSPIKVTQRGGFDDINTDIPYYKEGHSNTPASIKSLVVENCDFTDVTGNSKGDVIIGSSPNDDGTARTSATLYNYKVVAKEGTTTEVYTRSTKEAEESGANKPVVVEAGSPLMQLTNYVLNSDDSNIDLEVNKTYQLNYYFGDKGATIVNAPTVTFRSSDDSIVSVSSDGVLTAKKAGTATIYATYDSGEYNWQVNVVKAAEGEAVEEVENPNTSDGVLLFLGLTVVGFAGTALAYRRLHN